jgi:hypothetical protein
MPPQRKAYVVFVAAPVPIGHSQKEEVRFLDMRIQHTMLEAVRYRACAFRVAVAGVLLAGTVTSAHGQWLNYPDKRTPRTKDGMPNLTAPTPRLNGKPDVS